MQNINETHYMILEAAFKVFGKYGFDGTSIKLIAKEAGIAPGSIYNYFADKETLFETAVTVGWEAFLNEFKKIGEAQISREKKFDSVVDIGFDLLKKGHPLLRGMLFGANQRKLVQENMEKLLDYWEQIFMQTAPVKKEGNLSTEQRRVIIKYTIMGIMLAVSLEEPEAIDRELETIKQDMKLLIIEE